MKIKITGQDIACLLAITIGGVLAITDPSCFKDYFEYTVYSIILIKMFW